MASTKVFLNLPTDKTAPWVLKFRMEIRQDFVRKTSVDSARRHKPVPALISKVEFDVPKIRPQTCRLDGHVKQELNVKVQIDRLWLRYFSQQSINDQEDDGAEGGDENPAEVERLDLPETDEAAKKTADDRAGDANEDRDKEPAWVFPGHDKLCESPGDEAQKNPGENAHAQFLGQIRRAGKDLFVRSSSWTALSAPT